MLADVLSREGLRAALLAVLALLIPGQGHAYNSCWVTVIEVDPSQSLDGFVGQPYRVEICAGLFNTGGAGVSWAVTSGSLPPGLSLDIGSGRPCSFGNLPDSTDIHGVPTQAGSYSFEVTVSPNIGCQSLTRSLDIDIYPVCNLRLTSSLPRALLNPALSGILERNRGNAPLSLLVEQPSNGTHADILGNDSGDSDRRRSALRNDRHPGCRRLPGVHPRRARGSLRDHSGPAGRPGTWDSEGPRTPFNCPQSADSHPTLSA